MTTHTLTLAPDKQVTLTVDEVGSGAPFLFLHGGAGPQSMASFAQRLAEQKHAQIYLPVHPGFGGTPRPDWLNSTESLAELYVALIEQLDLTDVTVVGSSIGGWIAAEMALHHSARIGHFILLDAVGIEVEGQEVVDIFKLTPGEIASLSYYNPDAFRIDPSTFTDAQKSIFAGNRQALAVYGRAPEMRDPTLRGRLSGVNTPTLVLWGESDRIVTPDYGRAFASAIPTARFQLMPKAGHLPQLETPDQVLTLIWDFMAPAMESRL